MTLSLMVMVKNEAVNIEDCLRSAAGVDKIVVIDDHSQDNTAELARALGARVVERRLDDFSSQLNFGASQIETDWFFVLDADERFTPELMSAVKHHMEHQPQAVGSVRRLNYAFGQRHRFGPLKPDRVTRLFPKNSVKWSGLVHSKLNYDLPEVALGNIIHYTYRDWDHYLKKLEQYATLWAKDAHQKGRSISLGEVWMRVFWSLFKMFGVNLGIFGGPISWALCYFNGGYTLSKYLKLWELNKGGYAHTVPKISDE